MDTKKVYKHKSEERYIRLYGGITEMSTDFVLWEPLTAKVEAGTYVEMSDAEIRVALEAALIKIRGQY